MDKKVYFEAITSCNKIIILCRLESVNSNYLSVKWTHNSATKFKLRKQIRVNSSQMKVRDLAKQGQISYQKLSNGVPSRGLRIAKASPMGGG